MMFRNSFSKLPTAANKQNGPSVAVIELSKDKRLEFVIGNIIQRKSKEDIMNIKQYMLLNAYVEYKGKEFKEKLFEAYSKSWNALDNLIYSSDFGPKMILPYYIVDEVIDLFDLKDIEMFLRDVYKIEIPSRLDDVFNEQIEHDAKGTREQTYLKSDYLELAALVVVIKATYMILGQYAAVTDGCFRNPDKDYILFKFYRKNDKIFNSPAMDKALQFTSKLVNDQRITEEDRQKRVIDRILAEEEIVIDHLSKVVMQKLTVATIVDDTSGINVVNTMFNFVKNKLKSQGSVGNTLRPKMHLKDESSSTDNKESFIESHRAMIDVMAGETVTVNFATEKIERILPQLSERRRELMTRPVVACGNEYTLEYIYQRLQVFRDIIIPDQTLKMLEVIFKGIMDPRFIDYLKLENVISLMSLGFMYLWNIEFKQLAMLLVSSYHVEEEGFSGINSTSNKSRISQDLLMKLEKKFPLYKSGNKAHPEGELVIKRWIEEFGNSYYSTIWNSVLTEDFGKEVYGVESTLCPVAEDLKIQIGLFLLENEEDNYRS